MNERTLRYITTSVLAIATIAVVGTLAWGVVDGRLSMGRTGAPPPDTPAGDDVIHGPLFSESEEQGLIALSADRRGLFSISLPNGALSASRELPGRVQDFVATPGGVSVWVTFRDRQAIEVYTTSDLSPQASIVPPGAVEGIPEHLTFSENGDRLFITWADRDVISVYRHDQRRLSLAREITAAGTTGPVLRDRRASRIYRMNNAGELVEFFARNGERISVHERPAFLPAQAAAVGPEIRTVQGINAEAPATPASSEYPRALPAREDGDIAVLRGPSRIETYSLRELADAKDARGSRPAAVTSAGNGAVVVATDAGELLIIDGRSMEPVSVAEPSAETPTGGFAELIPWRVETSGNFACF